MLLLLRPTRLAARVAVGVGVCKLRWSEGWAFAVYLRPRETRGPCVVADHRQSMYASFRQAATSSLPAEQLVQMEWKTSDNYQIT